ncbi:BBE domain-containing protein [Nonomuraea sp. LPB2021202275-12-8]|uniref:BBE domain-containing protein n=1 Tax=Nonomuraea sp. LPB2021202275-12-8 TaxID=3120159 RepID=UPI00300C63F7
MPANERRQPGDSPASAKRWARRSAGTSPYTFPAPGESAARAFPAKTLARLGDIKKAYDPRNVFRRQLPGPGLPRAPYRYERRSP